MKTFAILICLLVSGIYCKAQLFTYTYYDNTVFLEPTFENNPVKGKKEGLLEFDGEKAQKKKNVVAPKFLSREAINYLARQRGAMATILYVSPTGNVLYARFMMTKELLDLNLITEEQLKGMYDSYRQLKFEVNKFNPEEDFDFCTIMGRAYAPE